jgi:hypothetical protein
MAFAHPYLPVRRVRPVRVSCPLPWDCIQTQDSILASTLEIGQQIIAIAMNDERYGSFRPVFQAEI